MLCTGTIGIVSSQLVHMTLLVFTVHSMGEGILHSRDTICNLATIMRDLRGGTCDVSLRYFCGMGEQE